MTATDRGFPEGQKTASLGEKNIFYYSKDNNFGPGSTQNISRMAK